MKQFFFADLVDYTTGASPPMAVYQERIDTGRRARLGDVMLTGDRPRRFLAPVDEQWGPTVKVTVEGIAR